MPSKASQAPCPARGDGAIVPDRRLDTVIDQHLADRHLCCMFRIVIPLSLLCTSGCSTQQPEWAETVAAYEVPLPSAEDKIQFLAILRKQAEANDYHVDSASQAELRALSDVSPITFNAAVWRGANDDEAIASAMDFKDNIGRIWLTFSRGKDAVRSSRFRRSLMPVIEKTWPGTASLPITPNGGIPLPDDLLRTPSGYIIKPSEAAKYGETTS